MSRKQFFYLFIGIILFLAAYLYYVDVERKNSITKYFPEPQIGDIYKIQSDEEDGESWMKYYKVAEVYDNRVVFYTSQLMSDASVDYILNHYDTTMPFELSRAELAAIKNGSWKNNIRKNTGLVEIIRRH